MYQYAERSLQLYGEFSGQGFALFEQVVRPGVLRGWSTALA